MAREEEGAEGEAEHFGGWFACVYVCMCGWDGMGWDLDVKVCSEGESD